MCIFDGCKKRAYYNYETEKIAKYCSEHKLENMIILKIKLCCHSDCKIQAVFNI